MKKIKWMFVATLLCNLVLLNWANDASAIPTFARKHNMPCSSCHAAFPKLNDFGRHFRENGYRMPGDKGTYIYQEAVPISAAVNIGWESENAEEGATKDSRNSIDFEEARLFAGGTLVPKVSYYTDLKLFEKTPSEAAELQEAVSGEHLQAFVILDDLLPDRIPEGYVNVAIGVREIDLPVSPMRRLTESQYLIFNTMPMAMGMSSEEFMNGLMFMTPQTGIEIKGNLPQGFHYGVSLLNGRGSMADNNDRKDIYGNIRYTRNGNTIGVLGYNGKNVLADVTDPANIAAGPDADITRYAVSIDANIHDSFNVLGMYMWMKDSYDEALMFNAMDSSKDREFTGYFIEADYPVMPQLTAALRWDNVTDKDNSKDQTQATVNLSYFFAENTKFLFEYSKLETDADFNLSEEATQEKFLARVSYAF
ncbi:MAG: porin [Nitrospirae bacterium]|nr:porin [Nitrospirota bacterium]